MHRTGDETADRETASDETGRETAPLGRTLALMAAAVVIPAAAFAAFGPWFEAAAAEAVAGLSGGTLAAAVAALLAGDLLLPVPSSVVLAVAGRELGVGLATLAGVAGLTVSCEAGYWSARWLSRAAPGGGGLPPSGRPAVWWVLLSRPLPILAEAATIVAGARRVPHGQFLAAVTIGNVWVCAASAALGSWAADWPVWQLLSLSAAAPLAATAAVQWSAGRPRRRALR